MKRPFIRLVLLIVIGALSLSAASASSASFSVSSSNFTASTTTGTLTFLAGSLVRVTCTNVAFDGSITGGNYTIPASGVGSITSGAESGCGIATSTLIGLPWGINLVQLGTGVYLQIPITKRIVVSGITCIYQGNLLVFLFNLPTIGTRTTVTTATFNLVDNTLTRQTGSSVACPSTASVAGTLGVSPSIALTRTS